MAALATHLNAETLRCIGQVVRVHKCGFEAWGEHGGHKPVTWSLFRSRVVRTSASARQLLAAVEKLAGLLRSIDATARQLTADLAESGASDGAEGALVEALEACEELLCEQQSFFEATCSSLPAPYRHGELGDAVDHAPKLFVKAIESIGGFRWAILIADGVRAPAGERIFTDGDKLVAASLAES